MTLNLRSIAVGAVIVAFTAALYVVRLGEAPIYLGGDEAHFGVQAHSIATTGRDTSGRHFPLFVNVHGPLGPHQTSTRWYQPLNFYLIAAALKVLPLTEWSIRLPMALVGVLSVALVYWLALALFARVDLAAVAALMLACTPAHFLLARQALDYVLPLPFVIGWLICLARILDTGSQRAAVVGGLVLGIGMFSYLAAWVLMPLLLVVGAAATLASGDGRMRPTFAMLAAFLIPALILIAWVASEPAMLSATLSRYSTPGAAQLNPLQRVREFLAFGNVQDKVAIYWENFNPAFLFLAGSSSLTVSTRQVGVFLLPVAVFLACGIYDRMQHARTSVIGIVLTCGLALAAVPPTLASERYSFQREAAVMPFAVLLATYGVARMLRPAAGWWRAVALTLLLVAPVQFAFFGRDYFGDYQARSAIWFDPANFRDVAIHLIREADRGALPAVYFAEDLDDVGARWGFYLRKHNRTELWARTRFYRAEVFEPEKVPAGALLVLYAKADDVERLSATGGWAMATTISDAATGNAAVAILRRVGAP